MSEGTAPALPAPQRQSSLRECEARTVQHPVARRHAHNAHLCVRSLEAVRTGAVPAPLRDTVGWSTKAPPRARRDLWLSVHARACCETCGVLGKVCVRRRRAREREGGPEWMYLSVLPSRCPPKVTKSESSRNALKFAGHVRNNAGCAPWKLQSRTVRRQRARSICLKSRP